MRKFILYAVLVLLIAATATLAYGFINAKRIRNFARDEKAVETKNDFDGELQEIEKYFHSQDSTDAQALQAGAANYLARLANLQNLTGTAQKEIAGLDTPRIAQDTRKALTEYYSQTGEQAKNLRAIMSFINDIFGVSQSFSQISESTTLSDIESFVSQAKEKSGSMNATNLPPELEPSGSQLVSSTGSFLDKMEKVATQKKEDPGELEQAYADFAKAQDEFSASAEKYISFVQDLTPLKRKIDSELNAFAGVYFDLK